MCICFLFVHINQICIYSKLREIKWKINKPPNAIMSIYSSYIRFINHKHNPSKYLKSLHIILLFDENA